MLIKMGLDAATRLVFLPDLEDRDLAALYCRSIIQLYLSQAEGFGLPPMEAMASGCPSIMLANTSLTEVYERSEEHTSELQSLMRISYAVFCLKKKNKHNTIS